MGASTNFQLFNPNQANQETDAQYTADALRSGGITTDAIFASALANKLFYQTSVFVYSMAQMLLSKGYSTSDSNATSLSAVLANIVTQIDLPLPQERFGIDLFGITSSIGNTVLFTPQTQAMFRISTQLYEVYNAEVSCFIQVTWTQKGLTFTRDMNEFGTANSGGFITIPDIFTIYCDALTPIYYAVMVPPSGNRCDIHIRGEEL